MDLRPDPDPDPEKARNSLRTPGASTVAPSSAPLRPSGGDPPGPFRLRRQLVRAERVPSARKRTHVRAVRPGDSHSPTAHQNLWGYKTFEDSRRSSVYV